MHSSFLTATAHAAVYTNTFLNYIARIGFLNHFLYHPATLTALL